MTRFRTVFLLLFYLAALAELGSILTGTPTVHLVAKPALMITLLLYFWAASVGYPTWRLAVVAALVFSWAGDVLLMDEGLFVAGLGAFLLAHVFYILAFQRTGAATGTLRPVDAVKFILVGVALMYVLYPGLGSMLAPVLAYALVLLTMAIWAHKRRGATSDLSFTLVALGSVLFVLSDALIAVNKFAFDVPYEAFFVMTTYIAAQYLIVRGLLKHDTD